MWAGHRPSTFIRPHHTRRGRITHRVHVPGRHAVACQLVVQMVVLVICPTSAANLGDYPNQQLIGRVETTVVEVPGPRAQ